MTNIIKEEIIALLAGIERSSHPIAQSLCFCRAANIRPASFDSIDVISGSWSRG